MPPGREVGPQAARLGDVDEGEGQRRVGLVVLGPKRLPQVANQIGSWLGQARRMTRMMKRQLEEEVNFDINAEMGLKPDTTAKPTADVSSPKYVHEQAARKTADPSPPEPTLEPAVEKATDGAAGTETTAERPDDYSPAHEPDAPGTGVGDDADYLDDEPEPAATALADAGEADAPVNAEIAEPHAEPKKKESA